MEVVQVLPMSCEKQMYSRGVHSHAFIKEVSHSAAS